MFSYYPIFISIFLSLIVFRLSAYSHQIPFSVKSSDFNSKYFTLKQVLHHGGTSPSTKNLFRKLEINPQNRQSIFTQFSFTASLGDNYHVVSCIDNPNPIDHLFGVKTVQNKIPNYKDKDSISSLAKMSYDAYIELSKEADWLDLDENWEKLPFGWEDVGLRGYVFADPDNSTIIIAFKGTSLHLINGGGPTASKDKLNVSLPSLIALNHSLPAVLFQTPGELLYAKRIGLLSYNSESELNDYLEGLHIYHFGHTADPVYSGTCNGKTSTCYHGGFAVSNTCTYDTRAKLGWRRSIMNHALLPFINQVIKEWPRITEGKENIAKCEVDRECKDCEGWIAHLVKEISKASPPIHKETNDLVYVFVDNFNITIEGKYTVGNLEHFGSFDYERNSHYFSQLCIDYSRLFKTVQHGYKLGYASVIVGSRPLPNDSIWRRIQKQGYEVTVFDRDSILHCEKEVDIKLAISAIKTVTINDPGILILVTGDRDYTLLVETAMKNNWIVQTWFWISD
ncbi:2774_t:CDS:2 [Racocetra fulgida]|uniref:triacylglycerol lipase n=1 Tax=Racocetra fulgida TaxID=60492 RepID=A0A9N8YZB9_9GLOM|nr:2774_t:CDS:2 [Racocetra fulgida]